MIALADVIRQYRGELLRHYGAQMLPGHHRSLEAITECRTSALGETLWACDQCPETTRVPISCGHRSCPRCQNHEVSEWLDRQREKLLPVNYFLLTFTLPAQLRRVAWDHQRVVFDCLFKAVSATLKQFARNAEHLGGDAGMTLVLHTHNRRLDFHPHIHVVMPGGVIERNRSQWKSVNGKYLFNEFALARVFRAKCLDVMNKSALTLPSKVPDKWVSHCKYAGTGEPALKYLARYLYRGVISESSIVSNSNGKITFRYKDSKTKTTKTRTLSGAEFLWKVLHHVLPRASRISTSQTLRISSSQRPCVVNTYSIIAFRFYQAKSTKGGDEVRLSLLCYWHNEVNRAAAKSSLNRTGTQSFTRITVPAVFNGFCLHWHRSMSVYFCGRSTTLTAKKARHGMNYLNINLLSGVTQYY